MVPAWANQFLRNPQPAQAYKTTTHPACNVCKQWSHLLYVLGESFKFQGIPLPFQGTQGPQFKLFRLLLPAMVQASWAPLVVKGRPSRQRLRATMRFQGCQMMRVLKEVNLIFFPSCFLRFAALILEPVRRYVHTKSIKIWDKEKLCRCMYFMDVLCSLLSVRSSCWKIAGFKVWVSGSPRLLQQEWRDDSWQSTELGPARILAKATLKETSVFCAHASGNIRAMVLWKYYCRKAQRPSGNSRNLYCILSKYFRAALVVWLIPGVSLPRRSMDLCPPGNNS